MIGLIYIPNKNYSTIKAAVTYVSALLRIICPLDFITGVLAGISKHGNEAQDWCVWRQASHSHHFLPPRTLPASCQNTDIFYCLSSKKKKKGTNKSLSATLLSWIITLMSAGPGPLRHWVLCFKTDRYHLFCAGICGSLIIRED